MCAVNRGAVRVTPGRITEEEAVEDGETDAYERLLSLVTTKKRKLRETRRPAKKDSTHKETAYINEEVKYAKGVVGDKVEGDSGDERRDDDCEKWRSEDGNGVESDGGDKEQGEGGDKVGNDSVAMGEGGDDRTGEGLESEEVESDEDTIYSAGEGETSQNGRPI